MTFARRSLIISLATIPTLSAGVPSTAQAPASPTQTSLAGRRISYEVAGYRIRMDFLSETELRWTYLAAPTPAETGKSETERCDRVDLRPELVLMAWTERSGANVVDVFDFEKRKVHANFVMPDGKRYKAEAAFTREA